MAISGSERFLLPADCAPKIRALYDYWLSIHPGTGLPGRRHFDPVDIPALLSSIWMIDVAREPWRFRFRLLGTEIVTFTGRDGTGRWLDEIYPRFGESAAFRFYRGCAESGRPSYRRGSAHAGLEGKPVAAEQLTLPLAADGETVDILLMMTLYAELPPPPARYRENEA